MKSKLSVSILVAAAAVMLIATAGCCRRPPAEVGQAEAALAQARDECAEQYAPEEYQRALEAYNAAERYWAEDRHCRNARDSALEAIELESSRPWQLIGLVMAYDALGRREESDIALSELIGDWELDAAYNIAYVVAYRGEADRAFEWLARAAEYKDPGLSEITLENAFSRIHFDPRWLPFLESLGKSPEQLADIEFSVTLPN